MDTEKKVARKLRWSLICAGIWSAAAGVNFYFFVTGGWLACAIVGAIALGEAVFDLWSWFKLRRAWRRVGYLYLIQEKLGDKES